MEELELIKDFGKHKAGQKLVVNETLKKHLIAKAAVNAKKDDAGAGDTENDDPPADVAKAAVNAKKDDAGAGDTENDDPPADATKTTKKTK